MQVRFWGTRGSIAKAGPRTVRYGGNTSCVEVRSSSGTLVVIDCGTGAHGLGQSLAAEPTQPVHGHLLISHTHWDHIQGIPFFAPLLVQGNQWDIYAPHGLSQSIRDTLAGQMQYTYFPVTIEALGAEITYHDFVEGRFEIGDIIVRSRYLNHPALTLGYRLEVDGVSMVYACDHEPFTRQTFTGRIEFGEQDRRHAEFLRDADLVIHDAQYTAAEYEQKIGWGHSPVEYAVAISRLAGVKQLALTHHDPTRDDEALAAIVHSITQTLETDNHPLRVFAAEEGLSLDLAAGNGQTVPHGQPEASAVRPATSGMAECLIFLGPTDSQTAATIMEAAAAEHVRLVTAPDSQQARQAMAADIPSLVIVDENYAPQEALDICRSIQDIGAGGEVEPVTVVVADKENPASELDEYATDWLLRPFSREYARTRIRACVLRTSCQWIRAQIPVNEEARLNALQHLDILDTEPEERFDRITRIASESFDVPIVLVSLIDKDRQWFKSCVGLNVKETPRDQAFCAHTILDDQVMIVPDTFHDARFADNPLVTGTPRIRFYAGCPLKLPDGKRVGTLCLIDSRPRQLAPRKIRLLQDLGHLVEIELARESTPEVPAAGVAE